VDPEAVGALVEQPHLHERGAEVRGARGEPVGRGADVEFLERAAVRLGVERPAPQIGDEADRVLAVDAERNREPQDLRVP